jgi:AraC-like DNA-binding protein
MVDLVVGHLKRNHLGSILPEIDSVDAVRNARVATGLKADILDLVWRHAGPETLLSIGQSIREVEYDPIWHAAVRSADPALLFDKWQRFEVFGHSQNRVEIEQIDEKHAAFRRYTVDGGTPAAPENLLICGLIIALLEEIGCLGLRCEMPLDNGAKHCIRQDGRFALPHDPGRLATTSWTIGWRSQSLHLTKAASATELPDIAFSPSCAMSNRVLVGSVLRALSLDVARQWKIDELARQAGLSARSLQRRLREASQSFSRLVRLVRVHEACRLLTNTSAPITAIRFCAGFSDSAHFSRDFRATIGMTPTEYRKVYNLPANSVPH